ncbi:MAG: hypothetical protein ACYC7J_07990 [Syntrophales bacterium]
MKALLGYFVWIGVGIGCLFANIPAAAALTPEQVIALKNAGVSEQTIQMMIRQEQDAAAGSPTDFAGRKEIRDKDGKPVVVYSTGRPAATGRTAEEQQTERAWEMLKNIIIDTRKSR